MKKPKILVCDDSEGVRESLKLILEDDYRLDFASDGYQAWEIIKVSPPDLVLLDIKMPRLNGIETVKKIRELNPKIRVLFVTGYQYTDVAKNATQLGAQDYIIKPFTPEELKKAVQKLLKEK